MTKLARLFFLLVSLAVFSGAAHAVVPIIDHGPIAIPAGVDEKLVVRAIKQALAGRDWRVADEKSGKIDATINVRNKHNANISIDYGVDKITIKYVSSINLDYVVKDGMPMIHRNYPRWINLLADDITKNLAISQIQ